VIVKRDVITYRTDASIVDWIDEHNDTIHNNVLESCESYLISESTELPIDIIRVKTHQGIITFSVSDLKAGISALEKSMNYFAEIEQYELAARARDCISAFKLKLQTN